jgi:hypothetical protein
MAVGAVHRYHAFEKGVTNDFNRQQAFANYAKAVSALNSTLASNPESRELACIACLLFAMFEIGRGNERGSMIHFNAGRNMMRDALQERPSPRSSGSLCVLISVFSRLETQEASFTNRSVSIVLPNIVLPSEILSLLHAREVLGTIIARMYSCVTSDGRADEHLSNVPLPSSLEREVEEIKTLLVSWSDKFEAYFISRSLKHTQRDHAAATVLRISYLSSITFIETYFNQYESSYDAYLPTFTKIVELSECVIKFAAETQTHSGRRFAFDIATVQQLQFVARKCRNRVLRRRAIDLSDIAGREGVFDGKSMAQILRWVVAKEEENLHPTEEEVTLGLADFGDEMPTERDRLRGIRADFDRLGQRCVIHTARRDENDWDGSWEDVEGSVPWRAQQIDEDEMADVVVAFLR